MAFWFLRGVRRGVMTTRYPNGAAEPWTRHLPTPPAFRVEALRDGVADELVAACPSGALRRDGQELVYDVGACTGCGRCLRPGVAEPSGVWELAATSRADLIKRIPLDGGATA